MNLFQSPNIDSQHAVIEYCENENTFVIQDLNTVNGTYINDCRVQNAAIRLAEQDVIRFGFNGMPFQFLLQGHNIQTVSILLFWIETFELIIIIKDHNAAY